MGLSKEEVLASTPAEINAYRVVFDSLEKRKDYRAGLISATIMNALSSKGSPRIFALEVIPWRDEDPAVEKARKKREVLEERKKETQRQFDMMMKAGMLAAEERRKKQLEERERLRNE